MTRRSRISTRALQERAAAVDAKAEAGELFRTRSTAAIADVSERLIDRTRTADQRRSDRLVLLELERLDREAKKGPPIHWMTVWKPPVFSKAWFKGLFAKRSRT